MLSHVIAIQFYVFITLAEFLIHSPALSKGDARTATKKRQYKEKAAAIKIQSLRRQQQAPLAAAAAELLAQP